MYTPEEVAGWFTHSPGGVVDVDKAKRFKRLHDAARVFAAELVAVLPPDRHESVNSLDCLQGAVSWGNSAISREGFASGVTVCPGCGMLADECLKHPACRGGSVASVGDAAGDPVGNPVDTKKKEE